MTASFHEKISYPVNKTSQWDALDGPFRCFERLIQTISIPLKGLSEYVVEIICTPHGDYLNNPKLPPSLYRSVYAAMLQRAYPLVMPLMTFVPLTYLESTLVLKKTNIFGFLLTYLYLCPLL